MVRSYEPRAPEPTLIDVLESQSVEEIEMLLDRLIDARAQTPYVDLRLPARLRTSFLGGAGAVMQLTAYWARACAEQGVLRTRFLANVNSEKLMADLEKYEHLLLAVCVAPKILTRGRDVDITALAKDAAQAVLSARRDQGPRRKMRSLFELVADKWPGLAPRSLYSRGDSRYPLRLKDEYVPLADRIVDLSQLKRTTLVDPKIVSALSWTLLELFQNTDQWAKSLPGFSRDVAAEPSCRLIHARWVSFDSTNATGFVGASPALLDYLQRSLGAAETQHRFFEITVLDMGPGISGWRAAERGAGEPTADEEARDLRWSLARRRTTSLDPTKGMGFHRAFLNLTTLGGFIQVRTGQISAFRDFSVDAYPTDREALDAALPSQDRTNWTMINNWVEPGGPRQTPVRRHVGTRVTLLIPDHTVRTE